MRLQALLHLPRIAGLDGTVDRTAAIGEVERLRLLRAAELAPFRSLARAPAARPLLGELEVRPIDRTDARHILENFHYLRSFRQDSVTIGAIYSGQIVALCSISPLDVPLVAEGFPITGPEEIGVISRVFAFDWAPRNVVSYLLARAEKAPEIAERVRLLLTYLNPNLDFSGASYRAANWLPYGIERGTKYAYLHARYITDRHVARLSPSDRKLVEYSHMTLRPLILLCRPLDKRLHRRHPDGFDFVFDRPK